MLSDSKYINQVKPEQIIKIFAKDGQVITIDQANKILEFMYRLADFSWDIAEKEMRKEKMDIAEEELHKEIAHGLNS